jgi:hypothetical protein
MDELYSGITELFVGNGIIIIIGCMIAGLFLKGTFKKLPNKYIPFINIAISLILGFAIPMTYEDKDIISKVIILIFLGLSSVGLYEALCIMIKSRFDIDVSKIFSKFSGDDSGPDLGQDDESEEDPDESVSTSDDSQDDPGA